MTALNGGGWVQPPQRMLTPAACKYVRARARGWNDVRNGKAFRETYDGWSKGVQFAYERGRTQAIVARLSLAAGREALPIWRQTSTILDVLERATGGTDRAMRIIEEIGQVRKRKAS